MTLSTFCHLSRAKVDEEKETALADVIREKARPLVLSPGN